MNQVQNSFAEKAEGGNRHFPELDGVRGLAILGVLIAHGVILLGVFPATHFGKIFATILVPGWGGVDLFFTLSGFLITGILLRSRNRPHYFRSFYMRRVLRIFPIYYLFLVVTILAARFSWVIAASIPASFEERTSYFL